MTEKMQLKTFATSELTEETIFARSREIVRNSEKVEVSYKRIQEIHALVRSGQIKSAEELLNVLTSNEILEYHRWQLAELDRLEAERERLEAKREALIKKAEQGILLAMMKEEYAEIDDDIEITNDQGEVIDLSERFPVDVLQEAWDRVVARSYGVQ